MEMTRYKFTVAYDGHDFSGWQIQPGNTRTVQKELETAFHTLLPQFPCPRIHGSGRTDAGVHALGQVFHVDLPSTCPIPPFNFPRAINTKLPASIRILTAEIMTGGKDGFHARFSAQTKTYQYKLITKKILSPFDVHRAGHLTLPINSNLFIKTIAQFQGTHNFSTFAAVRGNEPSPIPPDFYTRTIFTAESLTLPNNDGFFITFTGTGFLYKMVRLMIGSAHAVATGKLSPQEFTEWLEHPTGQKSRFCAPPEGLYLANVRY